MCSAAKTAPKLKLYLNDVGNKSMIIVKSTFPAIPPADRNKDDNTTTTAVFWAKYIDIAHIPPLNARIPITFNHIKFRNLNDASNYPAVSFCLVY